MSPDSISGNEEPRGRVESARGRRAGGPSLTARIYTTVLGGLLVLAGGGFTWGLVHAWNRAMVTRHWTEVPCVITASGIEPDPEGSSADRPSWRSRVAYDYEWNGERFSGGRIRRVEGPTPHRERAETRAARYLPGSRHSCYVDPADPKSAVLEHDTRAAIYTLWWPLLFAAGGAGMIWSAWARPRQRRRRDAESAVSA